MKKLMKRILPKPWVEKYRDIRERSQVRREFHEDANNYNNATNFHLIGSSKVGIRELLIFHTHALEKGLSHPKFRSNFGKRALIGLNANLEAFVKLNMDQSDFAYKNAMSVLKAYKSRHQNLGLVTPFFDSIFSKKEIKGGSEIAGVEIHHDDNAARMNFEELESFRTTQRVFSNKKVQMTDLKKALKIAMKTPSVCNRQPWKVYVTDNTNKIDSLLRLQKGYTGYGIPPILCLITVDRRAFIGSYERNEPYIDGGLFLMNFDLSLTYTGIASCILNAMLPNKEQEKIRGILDVPNNEVLISFVAAGYPKDKVLSAKSARKPIDDVLRVIS